MQIYSHSHLTSFEVMRYQERKSQVSQCFPSLGMEITSDFKLNVDVQPSMSCSNLIVA